MSVPDGPGREKKPSAYYDYNEGPNEDAHDTNPIAIVRHAYLLMLSAECNSMFRQYNSSL